METTVETKDDALTPAHLPTAEELGVLSPFERFAFRLTWRMNRGAWKRFWTFCQRIFGAGWIHVCTYNLMRVTGLEHVEAVSHERPILLVANQYMSLYNRLRLDIKSEKIETKIKEKIADGGDEDTSKKFRKDARR